MKVSKASVSGTYYAAFVFQPFNAANLKVAFGEGFRTPARGGTVVRFWGRRSKASQGGNRGEEGRCLVGRDLWRFVGRQQIARVAAQAGDGQSSRRERRTRACSVVRMWGFGGGAALKADLRVWRGQRSFGPARGWKRKRSGLRGGMRGDGHEVSILIRFGDGDRPGRAPSNVSMMIIRPPQHGHRRAGNGASASLSASSGLR
jgi:hypothetical protein